MKPEWTYTRIGEAFTTITGNTPSKADATLFGTFMPLVKPPELCDAPLYAAADGLSEAGVRLARTVPPGSVLISCIGNLGKVGLNTVPVAFNQQINAVVPDRAKAIPEFIFYQALSPAFKNHLEEMATGTTVRIINKSKFNAVPIVLPPLAEQNRIVSILDEAFEGIATAKANAEKNLQNARELFDSRLISLLGDSEGAWARKTLKEIAVDFGRGKSKHRPRNDPKLYGGPYPFIQTGDVRGSDHLITDYSQTYSEAGLAQSKLWPRGTLCITIAANIAETGVLNFDACFPDSVIGVVVDESHTSSKFLEYLLHTVKADLKAKGKGSAQDNINLGTFENERFPFPDLLEQERAVALLDELSSEIQRLAAVYERKLATLDELKKSLLHQAFSGKL